MCMATRHELACVPLFARSCLHACVRSILRSPTRPHSVQRKSEAVRARGAQIAIGDVFFICGAQLLLAPCSCLFRICIRGTLGTRRCVCDGWHPGAASCGHVFARTGPMLSTPLRLLQIERCASCRMKREPDESHAFGHRRTRL